jgi:hypothetical protein
MPACCLHFACLPAACILLLPALLAAGSWRHISQSHYAAAVLLSALLVFDSVYSQFFGGSALYFLMLYLIQAMTSMYFCWQLSSSAAACAGVLFCCLFNASRYLMLDR